MRPEHTPATADDIAAIKRGRDAGTPGEHIIDRVERFITRFVAFPQPEQATVIAVWILHTYMFENAYATPYLYVNSAEPQCGKTRLIETVMTVCRNPELSANLTASSLFRALTDEAAKPTLCIDEVDTIFTGRSNEELRSVLNSGYKYNGYVRRTLPGKDEESDVVKFSTFCPKLLAGIDNGDIPPTIADRCIPIILKRKRKDQECERFIPRKVEPEADALKEDVLEWCIANMEGVTVWEPDTHTDLVGALSDRSFEIAEPLMQIAMQAGTEYATRVKAALIAVFEDKADVTLTPQARCLAMARTLLNPEGDVQRDHLYTATLAEACSVSPNQVSSWLKKFDVHPQLLQFGGTRARGFYRSQFEDAWERYL